MSLEKIGKSFNLTVERGLKLAQGEIVTVRVLNRIYRNKWAIGIRGRVYSALSNLEFKPNQLLKARVVLENGQLVLKLLEPETTPSIVENILMQLNLPRDEISKEIIKHLLRANLPINEYLINGIKKNLAKLKDTARHRAIKLLTLLIDKSIDVSKSQIISLLAILDYSKREQREKNKRERHKRNAYELNVKELVEEVKKALKAQFLRKTQSDDSPLALFNHLYAKHENWIVFPFTINFGNDSLSGNIRMNYSHFARDFRKTIIKTSTKKGDLFFEIVKNDSGYRIRIFCDNINVGRQVRENLAYLKSILQNLSVKIDDNIYDAEIFDGFSEMKSIEKYRTIDTVG